MYIFMPLRASPRGGDDVQVAYDPGQVAGEGRQAGQHLKSMHRPLQVVITCGPEGATAYFKDPSGHRPRPLKGAVSPGPRRRCAVRHRAKHPTPSTWRASRRPWPTPWAPATPAWALCSALFWERPLALEHLKVTISRSDWLTKPFGALYHESF